jgi:AMIN domain
MKFLRTAGRLAALGLLLGVRLHAAQTQAPSPTKDAPLTIVHSVQPISGSDGTAIEILCSRPIVPTIRKAENPPRLVIDLPNTRLGMKKKQVTFRSAEIEDIRLDQFQEYPPIARIVVDLLQPATFSWDADGNRLSIQVHSPVAAAPPPPSRVATTAQPAALPAGSAVLKDVTLDGNRIDAGSSVTAGSDAAIVQLGRGGQVRVCPKTTISVTPSNHGRSLMLGLSTGAMEAHYTLGPSTDSIITPDFRIQLVGPGEFDYAISADSHGNTCVQALAGNTASVIVSEIMGDGTYQVKPTDHLLFHSGQLRNVTLIGVGGCGCPAPERPVELASSPMSGTVAASPATSVPAPAAVDTLPTPARQSGSETAALPPSNPKEVHIQVDAPFVFHGDDPALEPPPIVAVEILPLHSPVAAGPVEATVAPPAKTHHGFFGKLRGFFAAVFS